ncbi:DNA adenine methylase [Orientia tsutsugamushi]|uniref:Site-specific DNA-methyltransferase (adenine-specific) n=1 Tax=Orientia tsutsugamushi (strain Boryong) TaxID=357244 RepID=A5CFF1_ORITB|nr:Dam family site-specific DNA-(adenine-N6)-methyltransferase [Orientia tsutsugamushi]CAM81108.1 site-specific DNA adenine methylase [Orientia tsutsugamushi str. Boryong]
MSIAISNEPKPFLHWVGGKRRIVNKLIEHLPSGPYYNYYEPFLGGGALFFQVKHLFKQCFLSDINLDLITSYHAVKKNPNEVNRLLNLYHENHSENHYYKIRDNYYSNDPNDITAKFIYLNKYSFRGIYRLNRDGTSAQTFSDKQYLKLHICSRINKCSKLLTGTSIYAMDFSFIEPKKGDFVYLDPPYHQSGERFYTRVPFDEKEQIRLRDFVYELNNKGVKIMLSNNNTAFIRDIYKNFFITHIPVTYSINQKRNLVNELIIINYFQN